MCYINELYLHPACACVRVQLLSATEAKMAKMPTALSLFIAHACLTYITCEYPSLLRRQLQVEARGSEPLGRTQKATTRDLKLLPRSAASARATQPAITPCYDGLHAAFSQARVVSKNSTTCFKSTYSENQSDICATTTHHEKRGTVHRCGTLHSSLPYGQRWEPRRWQRSRHGWFSGCSKARHVALPNLKRARAKLALIFPLRFQSKYSP